MNAVVEDVQDERQSTLAWLVAGCTAAAGLIHFAVITEHTGGDAIVPIGFAAMGIAQVALAAMLLSRRASSRVVAASMVVNVAALGFWAWSRTIGLPWDPYGGQAEAVGTLDLTSAGLEAAAVTLGVGLLLAPQRLKLPQLAAAVLGIAAVGLAAVVVVTPESEPASEVASSSSASPAASGGGGHHGGGGAEASTVSADGDHAADMLRIDRARCDLGFNPQAYWDEALAMNVDTYSGGSMSMTSPSAISEVTGPTPLQGKGSERLDSLISLTSVSSGEGAAAALILELAESTDAEYDAWRKWVAANPGSHSSTAPTTTNGQPAPPSMGHPGPTPWKALVDRAECEQLSEELAQARKVSERYPTVADAMKGGWFPVTSYVPGIAAHLMNFGIVDGEFDIDKPEMLLYDGTDPDSRIVGLSYYVRLDGTVAPTQGFVGDNDKYHRHFGLCIGAGGVIGDSATTEQQCAEMGGRKSNGANGWMSHAWVVPGCESPWGVFSGENPILVGDLTAASGDEGSEGCSASSARDRYDQSPGQSDLANRSSDDQEAAGP